MWVREDPLPHRSRDSGSQGVRVAPLAQHRRPCGVDRWTKRRTSPPLSGSGRSIARTKRLPGSHDTTPRLHPLDIKSTGNCPKQVSCPSTANERTKNYICWMMGIIPYSRGSNPECQQQRAECQKQGHIREVLHACRGRAASTELLVREKLMGSLQVSAPRHELIFTGCAATSQGMSCAQVKEAL